MIIPTGTHIHSTSQIDNPTYNLYEEKISGKNSFGRNIKNTPSPKLGLLDIIKKFFSALFCYSKSPSSKKISPLDLTPVYNKINQLEKKQGQLEKKVESLEKTSAILEKNSQENDDGIQCLNRQVLRLNVESDKAKEAAAKQRTYRYLRVGAGCLLGSAAGVAVGGSLGIGMGAILGASAILSDPKILETVCQKGNDYIHGMGTVNKINVEYFFMVNTLRNR